jgi:peroxiredoxin
MVELGQLESSHREFDKRNARVVVVSLEEPEDAKLTQADFPHLLVVTDANRQLAEALDVVHAESNPQGGDTTAPTTLITDGSGIVRWVYRSDRIFKRLSPGEVLAALDTHIR